MKKRILLFPLLLLLLTLLALGSPTLKLLRLGILFYKVEAAGLGKGANNATTVETTLLFSRQNSNLFISIERDDHIQQSRFIWLCALVQLDAFLENTICHFVSLQAHIPRHQRGKCVNVFWREGDNPNVFWRNVHAHLVGEWISD